MSLHGGTPEEQIDAEVIKPAHDKLVKAVRDLKGVSEHPFKRPSPFEGVPMGGAVERFDFVLFKTVLAEVYEAGEGYTDALAKAAELKRG